MARGGKRPYEKGRRGERELARLLGGERVPLSGAAGGGFSGDVMAFGLLWQSKWEADGFRRLYQWLETHDALALKADRKPWLVVMPIYTFLGLIEDVREGKDRGKTAAG